MTVLVTGARRVYIFSQLVYTVGSLLMALIRHPVAVILLSPTAGIMYATLFTMPYVLVAKYHSSNTVSMHVLYLTKYHSSNTVCPVPHHVPLL